MPTISIDAVQFFERYPWNSGWVAVALGFFFAAVDFLTGPYIRFPIFFLIPVMLMAWNNGFLVAIGLAIGLCVVRFSFDLIWIVTWSIGYSAINSAIYCCVLSLMAFITARLATYTHAMRTRIKQLEGFLPICSFCKAIRDGNGQWQQLESYITTRSEAKFSHGLCPACAEKHYGAFLNSNSA